MSPAARALAYIQHIEATSGQGGHDATFHAACAAAEGFDLDEATLRSVLNEWNLEHAFPPWSERELEHKVQEALKITAGSTRAGYLLNAEQERPSYSPGPIVGASPRPRDREWNGNGVSAFLQAAFQPGEGVALVACVPNPDDPARDMPKHGGQVIERDKLIELAGKYGDSLEGHFRASEGRFGTYVRLNPMKPEGKYDKDVTTYRHVLVEFDAGGEDAQIKKLKASNAPITALIHSGGRSVHAWVRVDAPDLPTYRTRWETLKKLFPEADQHTGNPSRFGRLPGCRRRQGMQRLLALNLGAASWETWQQPSAAEATIKADWRPRAVRAFDTSKDPTNILGQRWLCKGASALWVGASGIGKSSLIMQALYSWALGRAFFGIMPTRPLKSLLIQSENDYGDMAEELQGIEAGLGITEADYDLVDRNVILRREVCKRGQDLANYVREQVKEHQPDCVWLDPLMAYFGKDINSQEDCAWFFRTLLSPIAEESGIVWHVIHHTGKPPQNKGRAYAGWAASDFAYIGSGSAEMTNWARAVVHLKPEKAGGFRLLLPKRGKRAGLVESDGTPVVALHKGLFLDWAKDKILWQYGEQAPAEEPKASKKFTAGEIKSEPEVTAEQFTEAYERLGGKVREIKAALHISFRRFKIMQAEYENRLLAIDAEEEL